MLHCVLGLGFSLHGDHALAKVLNTKHLLFHAHNDAHWAKNYNHQE